MGGEWLGSDPVLRPTFGVWESVLVRRGIPLWLGVRVLVFLGTRGDVTPMAPTFASSVGVIGVVGLVALADLRRRREEILLANLGIPVLRAVLYCSLAALGVEVLLLGLSL